ncbi:MAG: hypothetical protein U0821_04155 [Chloroflexota bacterium]
MVDVGKLVADRLSGQPALELATSITRFHRPPGGAGYHATTNLVAEHLRAEPGVDIQVDRYPLDGKTVAGHAPLPLAWEPYSASVAVVGPVQEPVVDMRTASSCLAWWSKPTPPGGIRAELVDLGTAESDADFESRDLRGKVALIGHTERPGAWMHAARRAMELGAIGILSDYLFYSFPPHRTRAGLPEAVFLLRLPNQRGEFNAWACSISYAAAQRLRELLRIGTVTLDCDIQCRAFEGEGQNLLATIPGTDPTAGTVYFMAHCSAATQPCANCAAGPALMVEVARTLNGLIQDGQLPRPRRSIRFLFVIEGLGSRAHIDANRDEVANVKAAFCFDSVGHDQGKLKSALLFYRSPDSTRSFVNEYFAGVMERVPQGGSWVFADDSSLAPVQFTQAPYTPWSDNHYWVGYGVPCPLIMSWPDKFFHTQLLTPDNLDSRVFRRVGITSAVAAYEIAAAGGERAGAIAAEVAARSRANMDRIVARLRHLIADSPADAARLGRRVLRDLDYRARVDGEAIASTRSLVSDQERPRHQTRTTELASELSKHAAELGATVQALTGAGPLDITAPTGRLAAVPRKLRDGTETFLSGSDHPKLARIVAAMQAEDPTIIYDSLRPMGDEFWNLVDGKRTIAEIADELCLQFGFELSAEHFVPLAEGMAEKGFLTFDEP